MSHTEAWYQTPVAHGEWLYDGLIRHPMYVIEQNYDFFYSMYLEDGIAEEGEEPQLNEDGKAFYLFFGELPNSKPYSVSNMGPFMSLHSAKAWAESLPYFCNWHSV